MAISGLLDNKKSKEKETDNNIKWLKIAGLTFFLIIASCFFGFICNQINASFDNFFTLSYKPLWSLLYFFIAVLILLICASVVASLVRPIWVAAISFFLSAVSILLTWGISINSITLCLIYLIACIIFIYLVKYRLSQLIKFSIHAISKSQKVIWLILILMVCSNLYFNLADFIKNNKIVIPDSFIEVIMSPVENKMQEQLPVEQQGAIQQDLKIELANFLNDFLNNKLEPYKDFVALVIVFNVFLWLVMIERLIIIFSDLLLYLVFLFLKVIGIAALITEDKPVQKLILK